MVWFGFFCGYLSRFVFRKRMDGKWDEGKKKKIFTQTHTVKTFIDGVDNIAQDIKEKEKEKQQQQQQINVCLYTPGVRVLLLFFWFG